MIILNKCLTLSRKVMRNTRIIILAIACGLLASLSLGMRAERGVASYYHDKFHGRRMANGDIYHKDSFTCAHRRYALGTWLRVTNVRNGKAVIVQVTDRGPYSRRFTIDLSRAAARYLEIVQTGWAPVEIAQVTNRQGGIVPLRLEEEEPEDLIDIELDFVPAAQYPFPNWSPDSID